MKDNRLNQMQFLRTLAFLNIYMLHAGHWDLFGYPSWFGAISAVSFFFMLSGFLTGYYFHTEDAKPGMKAYGSYMYRKLSKFYPLYALTTLCAVIFSSLPQDIASGYPDRILPSTIQLFKNLLCIQSWFPDGFLAYNGPCWFSSTLLFLTALNIPFFFLLKRIEKSRKVLHWLLALTILFFCGTFLYSYLVQNGSLQFLHYILPLSRIGIYLGSMTLGLLIRIYTQHLANEYVPDRFFTAAEILSLMLWFCSLFFPWKPWMEWNAAWILPNSIVLIAFSFGRGFLSRLFSSRMLVWIGNVTFECYLIHSLIIPLYGKFNKFDTTYTLGSLFSLVFCLLITYAIAFYVHRPSIAAHTSSHTNKS